MRKPPPRSTARHQESDAEEADGAEEQAVSSQICVVTPTTMPTSVSAGAKRDPATPSPAQSRGHVLLVFEEADLSAVVELSPEVQPRGSPRSRRSRTQRSPPPQPTRITGSGSPATGLHGSGTSSLCR